MKLFDDFGVTLAGGRFCRLGVHGDAPEMPWNALGCPGFPNIAIATSIGSATEENATKKTDSCRSKCNPRILNYSLHGQFVLLRQL